MPGLGLRASGFGMTEFGNLRFRVPGFRVGVYGFRALRLGVRRGAGLWPKASAELSE